MNAQAISHIALCVTDLDRSVHFYRDLLGFELLEAGIEDEIVAPQRVLYEKHDRKFRFAALRCDGANFRPSGEHVSPPGGRAALLVLIAPQDAGPSGTAIKLDQVGISHIGFWVNGLDAIHATLSSHGVDVVVPPHDLNVTVRSAFVADPDGILIQLDEVLRAPS